jgi:O-antigen/teichoic acid export membrane protein
MGEWVLRVFGRNRRANPTANVPAPQQITLKDRVLNAGVWSLAGFGLGQVIRFGTNLLMTRLLVPKMFGVMAIASLVLAGLAMFSDVGLKLNIVRSNRGNDPAFLNTAWVVQILRGVALCLTAMGIALLIFLADRIGMIAKDTAYADPSLPYVVAALSMTAVIGGFQSTKLFEASRNLSIAGVVKLGIAAQIAGLSCMIGWALIDRSIWALIAGNICSALVMTLLSHFWLPGVANYWEWDRSAFWEIFQFGKWIFLSSILGFLVGNGDRLLLGGLVSADVLGVYVIAFSMFSLVDQVLTKITNDVTFPALSEIARERPLHLKTTYYRFYVVFASFAYFCSGILMTSGQLLIELLYDRRYEEAGWMLEILAVALVSVPFRSVTQCFMALGMPRLDMNGIAIHLVTLFVVTPVAFHYWGVAGSIWGIVLSHFSYLPLIIFYSIKYRLLDARKELFLLPMVVVGMGAAGLFALAIGR